MKKNKFNAILLILLFTTSLQAEHEVWSLKSIKFSMENDADFETDFNYTHGAQISLLYLRENRQNNSLHIPFLDASNKEHFISFAYAQQMFTPYDRDSSSHIKDDRPYAGWSYIELALHQTTKSSLDSLTAQIGVVGPSSKMEDLQNFYHDLVDARHSQGWNNQLKNEIGIQLNYMHKWYKSYDKILNMDSVLVPYAGVNLGNISIKASTGFLYRIGYAIPKDFGIDSLDEGSFSSIPLPSNKLSNSWSYYLNILAGTNLVLRDIFLDGNTFVDSFSVSKKYLNAYVGAGVSIGYKNFTLHYTHQYYTKKYDARGKYETYKGYGTVLLSYDF